MLITPISDVLFSGSESPELWQHRAIIPMFEAGQPPRCSHHFSMHLDKEVEEALLAAQKTPKTIASESGDA